MRGEGPKCQNMLQKSMVVFEGRGRRGEGREGKGRQGKGEKGRKGKGRRGWRG